MEAVEDYDVNPDTNKTLLHDVCQARPSLEVVRIVHELNPKAVQSVSSCDFAVEINGVCEERREKAHTRRDDN